MYILSTLRARFVPIQLTRLNLFCSITFVCEFKTTFQHRQWRTNGGKGIRPVPKLEERSTIFPMKFTACFVFFESSDWLTLTPPTSKKILV